MNSAALKVAQQLDPLPLAPGFVLGTPGRVVPNKGRRPEHHLGILCCETQLEILELRLGERADRVIPGKESIPNRSRRNRPRRVNSL